MPTCNGQIGATGMCLGGHLAYRCALDARVAATVCYFATDIHSHSLGEGKIDDSLERAKDIKGELVMVRVFLDLRSQQDGLDPFDNILTTRIRPDALQGSRSSS